MTSIFHHLFPTSISCNPLRVFWVTCWRCQESLSHLQHSLLADGHEGRTLQWTQKLTLLRGIPTAVLKCPLQGAALVAVREQGQQWNSDIIIPPKRRPNIHCRVRLGRVRGRPHPAIVEGLIICLHSPDFVTFC